MPHGTLSSSPRQGAEVLDGVEGLAHRRARQAEDGCQNDQGRPEYFSHLLNLRGYVHEFMYLP